MSKRYAPEDVEEIIDKIEELLDMKLKELSENIFEEQKKGGSIQNERKARGWGPFVSRYYVIISPEGKPRIMDVRKLKHKRRPRKMKNDEKGNLLLDVISKDNQVQIVAEIPGVLKRDINVRGTEEQITVVVDNPHYDYYRNIEMPCRIKPEAIKTRFINGVLEITAKKAKHQKY